MTGLIYAILGKALMIHTRGITLQGKNIHMEVITTLGTNQKKEVYNLPEVFGVAQLVW